MERRLLEISEARRAVLERAARLDPQEVPLREALGRVLAEEVVAPEAVPAFDNSAMDGFAVRAADTRGAAEASGVTLRVVGEARAGHPADADVGSAEAVAISTGAMVPGGADAVVRVEDTEPGGEEVEVRAEVEPGRNVRRAGEDIAAGEQVLESGTPLGPAELGVLASAARPQVACGRRPRVAVVISGDELIAPGEPSWPGSVRDSNAYTVPALVEQCGAELHSVEKAGDDPQATLEAIGSALRSDVVVISGGVSVGRHDHVRPSLDALGAEQVFWGVALRPGKPTWFGVGPEGVLAFGLPGNPVSAMVTFILFVRPALIAMQGGDPSLRRLSASMASDYPKQPGRAHAVRCRLEAAEHGWTAWPTGDQGSHVLTSMLGADGLAILPTQSGTVRAGERVLVEVLPAPTIRA